MNAELELLKEFQRDLSRMSLYLFKLGQLEKMDVYTTPLFNVVDKLNGAIDGLMVISKHMEGK